MKRVFQSLDLLVLSCLFLAAGSQTELVKNLECYIVTYKRAHCSWMVDSNVRDLRVFYELFKEDHSVSIYDDSSPADLQECSWYSHNSSSRAGCDLQAVSTDDIEVSFKGTLNNTAVTTKSVRTEFTLRPPALTWTVTKTRDAFNISWILPDAAPVDTWKVIINYTECGKPVEGKHTEPGATTYSLIRVSRCQYAITIKAENEGRKKEQTPLSSVKYFDAESDPNAAMYAIIIIPLMLAGLTALAVVCCRKIKEHIFPEVPKPLDLLSDISENNNTCIAPNLYVVAEEGDSCKITLVTDPQIEKSAS
ncbi:uncharacterized protein [Pempheris klunzingeri]|uniref:uncharacterized protein n=1 Tax=Pempheris klunzingeri TaxID=3127111 RepID=UPI00397FB823